MVLLLLCARVRVCEREKERERECVCRRRRRRILPLSTPAHQHATHTNLRSSSSSASPTSLNSSLPMPVALKSALKGLSLLRRPKVSSIGSPPTRCGYTIGTVRPTTSCATLSGSSSTLLVVCCLLVCVCVGGCWQGCDDDRWVRAPGGRAREKKKNHTHTPTTTQPPYLEQQRHVRLEREHLRLGALGAAVGQRDGDARAKERELVERAPPKAAVPQRERRRRVQLEERKEAARGAVDALLLVSWWWWEVGVSFCLARGGGGACARKSTPHKQPRARAPTPPASAPNTARTHTWKTGQCCRCSG